MVPTRHILYATDFSEASLAAFQVACSLSREPGSQLLVLHVLVPPATVLEMERAFLAPEERFKHAMDELLRLRPAEEGTLTDYLLRQGEPAEEILRAAEERDCDFIVLGTHGRSGLGRVIMGSVAEAVLRRATCPVITMRSGASLQPLRTVLYATDLSESADRAFPVARAGSTPPGLAGGPPRVPATHLPRGRGRSTTARRLHRRIVGGAAPLRGGRRKRCGYASARGRRRSQGDRTGGPGVEV